MRELFEEHVGHRRVVVLARVDQDLRAARASCSSRKTGAIFMKLGRAPTALQINMARHPLAPDSPGGR